MSSSISGTTPPDTFETTSTLLTVFGIAMLVGIVTGGSLAGVLGGRENIGLAVGSSLGAGYGIPAGSVLIAYVILQVQKYHNTPKKPEDSKNCVADLKPRSIMTTNEGNRFITDENL